MNTNRQITTEDIIFAIQQRNLVYNYNFLYYSNQVNNTAITYNHPDGWLYVDAGSDGSIGFNPTNNTCMINKSSGSDPMTFGQVISEFPRWQDALIGQDVSACIEILNSTSGSYSVTFTIRDGITSNSATVTVAPNQTTKIDVNLSVSSTATLLAIELECSKSNAAIFISKAYANIGKIALPTLPCIVEGFIGERKQYLSTENPPAEELSLCKTTQELTSSYTRLNSFLNGKFGKGSNGFSFLPSMSGYFSRAWDNGANIDPDASTRTALGNGKVTGDNVGTVEQDQFKQHLHSLNITNSTVAPGPSTPVPVIGPGSSKTQDTGGSETRGVNIAELYTIKWT